MCRAPKLCHVGAVFKASVAPSFDVRGPAEVSYRTLPGWPWRWFHTQQKRDWRPSEHKLTPAPGLGSQVLRIFCPPSPGGLLLSFLTRASPRAFCCCYWAFGHTHTPRGTHLHAAQSPSAPHSEPSLSLFQDELMQVWGI